MTVDLQVKLFSRPFSPECRSLEWKRINELLHNSRIDHERVPFGVRVHRAITYCIKNVIK